MLKLRHKHLTFFGGLLAIIIVYSLYNIYLTDTKYYYFIPRITRHFAGLGCVLLVYGIGTLSLKNYTISWIMLIWHLFHAILIALLVLIGIYAWGWWPIAIQWHNLAFTLFEFLISPSLYVIMGLINTRFAI
jgi:hypothetical protein